MGQTLSSPVTTKHSECGGNDRYFYAVSEMQGWRISMEDAHAAVLDLEPGKGFRNAFFAVYDGHGGASVAKYAGQNVHKRLIVDESYEQGEYDVALRRAFLNTDEDVRAYPSHTRDIGGCTAVAALVTSDNKIYVANAGDSRSVIAVKGEAKALSFDHKPTSEVEKARINSAGGFVEFGRVNGNLALSRALGDFEFKANVLLPPEAQIITANPDVTCHDITEDDEFLVLACDGIWDCMSSQAVVDFVRYQVAEGTELQQIGENMCNYCLAPDAFSDSGTGIGCDNMTVLIVAITHGRTKEEWYAWIRDRVRINYGYETPTTLPPLYSQSRVVAHERREADAAAGKDRLYEESRLGALARILGSTGDIYLTRHDVHSGTSVFRQEDCDEEIEPGGGSSSSFFSETLGVSRTQSPSPTRGLRRLLEEFERDAGGFVVSEDGNDGGWENSQTEVYHHLTHSVIGLQGEAPYPPKPFVNGDGIEVTPVEQHISEPGGDAAHPSVSMEGLLDKSEDPMQS